MQTKIEKLPKSVIKLTVTVESAKVKDTYEEVLEEKVKTAKVEGFREGKAPKKLVEEKIGVSNLYGDVINKLLQTFYSQALKENHIAALSNPKVEIKEFDLEKDFEFTAELATKPEIKMGDYKKALKTIYEEKNKAVKAENAEKLKKGEEIGHDHSHLNTNDIIMVLLDNAEVEIADLMVEEEANRMLTQLIQQAQSIGLSLEDYLKAQNKTAEQLRKDYEKSAETNIKAEFVLSKLVEDEKIEVTQEEIDSAFNAAGVSGVEQRINDPIERLYVKGILQKNKVITKLIEETEGENHHE